MTSYTAEHGTEIITLKSLTILLGYDLR